MRILNACLDQEQLWVLDDIIVGLYSIDQKTFETKCVIDYQKLFPSGKFNVSSLFKWKEDYIVIIPREINRKWIFYNKITGKIEYRKIIERKCQEIFIAADQERNQLYFLPLYIHDPILIVDMNTLNCLQIIENWSKKVPDNCYLTAWKGAYNGQYVFFPIMNTKILVRIDCRTRKVNLLELSMSENIIDLDYALGELWILPIGGNRLYQVDENGKIINTVKLLMENSILLPDFARIVADKRYLFLLPYYRNGIYVYDKLEKKTHIIPKEILDIRRKKNKEFYLRYWEYCVKENQICFLPYHNSYVEIDLDTLACHKKELCYPTMWSDEEKIKKHIQSHISEEDFTLREIDVCGLEVYLEYTKHLINKKILRENVCASKIAWNMLKTEVK